jgi:methyltransferase (TIGR00027 family)
MFESLKRIVYQVSDIEKARDWYKLVLNQEPTFDSMVTVIFLIGNVSLLLVPCNDTFSNNNEKNIAFWNVDDVDEAYKKLIELGATGYSEVVTVATSKTAKVIDPFGNILGLYGPVIEEEKKDTVEKQPTDIAYTAAFSRAYSAADDRFKGTDYLAELFITKDSKNKLKDRASREWIRRNFFSPGFYEYFIARTAFFDDAFKNALSENIPQIVILGAGYDTRAYRFKDLLNGTRIFELDVYPAQARKKEILKKADIQIPENVSFVNINFERDNIENTLLESCFDRSKKTLFIWEGVTFYLEEESIINILDFIKSKSGKGSIVCFDYMSKEFKLKNEGEPFKFWIDEDKISSFLDKHGLKVIESLDQDQIQKMYLTMPDGSPYSLSLADFCFVKAIN